jgi:hypothetical protein
MFIIFYFKNQLNFSSFFFVGTKLIKKIHQWNLSEAFVGKVRNLKTFKHIFCDYRKTSFNN